MKNLEQYTPETSAYEVLAFFYDEILAGRIKSFAELKNAAVLMPDSQKKVNILQKAFELLRQLGWGFFKDLNKEKFPKVWKELVMSDRDYHFAGDLKRSMSIPEVYLALLDIHGYTKFCQENKRNVSMLDLLDRMIQEDIPRVCKELGVISRRSRGDEILLLGAGAAEVTETVLRIMEYFSKRRRIKDETTPHSPAFDVVLPEFQISAGIAGGQKYTPLVITMDGDLSGDIVNTAARLQARANKISPNFNRILITIHVYQKLKNIEDSEETKHLKSIDYFNSGTVEFKGVKIPVYDTVFLNKDAYRLAYRDSMEGLYEALDGGMWKAKIFEQCLDVAARVVTNLPKIALKNKNVFQERTIDKPKLLERIKNTLELFRGEKYEKAVGGLGTIVQDFAQIEDMDELALEYLQEIYKNYKTLVAQFIENLDKEVTQNLDQIYTPKEKENYSILLKHYETFPKVQDAARQRLRSRKSLWYKLAESSKTLEVKIQSKKEGFTLEPATQSV